MYTSHQPERVKTEVWAVVEPTVKNWQQDDKGRPILDSAKVVKTTQKKPSGNVKAGSILVKLVLDINSEALLPLLPEAVIKIEPSQTEAILVEADAAESGEQE